METCNRILLPKLKSGKLLMSGEWYKERTIAKKNSKEQYFHQQVLFRIWQRRQGHNPQYSTHKIS